MTEFTAKNPDFEALVRNSFARQAAMTSFAASIADITPGRVVLEMPFNSQFTQQHGFLHGGITAALLDTACGYSALSLMPAGTGVLTIEFKTNFLAPGDGPVFRFVGQVLKPGRTITVSEGRAYTIKDGVERLYASATATIMTVADRANIQG
jgi:uncharacterized protein (TIGR00369 family)